MRSRIYASANSFILINPCRRTDASRVRILTDTDCSANFFKFHFFEKFVSSFILHIVQEEVMKSFRPLWRPWGVCCDSGVSQVLLFFKYQRFISYRYYERVRRCIIDCKNVGCEFQTWLYEHSRKNKVRHNQRSRLKSPKKHYEWPLTEMKGGCCIYWFCNKICNAWSYRNSV